MQMAAAPRRAKIVIFQSRVSSSHFPGVTTVLLNKMTRINAQHASFNLSGVQEPVIRSKLICGRDGVIGADFCHTTITLRACYNGYL